MGLDLQPDGLTAGLAVISR